MNLNPVGFSRFELSTSRKEVTDLAPAFGALPKQEVELLVLRVLS